MAVQVVLDRVEGPVAVLSVLDGDEPPVEVPARWLPDEAREGDTLTLSLAVHADDRRADLAARIARLARE